MRLLSLLNPEDAADVIEDIPDIQAAEMVEDLPSDQAAAIMEEKLAGVLRVHDLLLTARATKLSQIMRIIYRLKQNQIDVLVVIPGVHILPEEME